MPKVRTLPAFSSSEKGTVHELLASVVARMMGRKMEEADWADVYCRAKGIPVAGWSNLNLDVMHAGLGIEHKMLRYTKHEDILQACGSRQMHPSLTRSIRVPTGKVSANRAMRDILTQYGELIAARTKKVQATAAQGTKADMRTGWLLWQTSLRQFMYFEEPMVAPDPDDYEAHWETRSSTARKGSRNLWVFDKATEEKRYSITTVAGAKIQGYFKVPMPNDPNLYLFTVIGEVLLDGRVRCWLSRSTHAALSRHLGSLDFRRVSKLVTESMQAMPDSDLTSIALHEPAVPIEVSAEAYQLLTSKLRAVNDDHRFQLLLSAIQ